MLCAPKWLDPKIGDNGLEEVPSTVGAARRSWRRGHTAWAGEPWGWTGSTPRLGSRFHYGVGRFPALVWVPLWWPMVRARRWCCGRGAFVVWSRVAVGGQVPAGAREAYVPPDRVSQTYVGR